MPKLRNITVTLEEHTAKWARLEAAKQESSVSRFLGKILQEKMAQQDEYEHAMSRALRRKAFLKSDGRYLTREEANERPRVR